MPRCLHRGAPPSFDWVKYEINLAVIRSIQENNFNIIVAKIEDCEIHPELTPYLFVNCADSPSKAIDQIAKIIQSKGRGIIPKESDWQKKIVDRNDELDGIEAAALDGLKIIFISGTYGIGKSTLAEHATVRIFQKHLARFPLTRGHDTLRLVLEMAGRAKMPLAEPDASKEILLSLAQESANELVRQGYIIFFDDIEFATDDGGQIKDYFKEIIHKITDLKDNPPILIACSYYPDLDDELKDISHIVRIGPLKDNYILSLLQRWVKMADPGTDLPNKESLQKVASELHGYPIAARLASYVIAKYSLNEALSDLGYFKGVRIDVAKQLIGRSRGKLTQLQMSLLEALTISDIGLSQYDLSVLLKEDVKEIREAVNDLFSNLFLIVERDKLQILPLMKDYFWNQVLEQKSWKESSRKIASYAQLYLAACDRDSEDFVHYSTIAYRLFALADEFKKAESLAYYFKGELREACIRLYHAKDYKLSLKYADMWLDVSPTDHQINWYKARCLTRLEKYKEAKKVLNDLEISNYAPYKVDHAKGLLYRDMGDLPEANTYFRHGLDKRPQNIPLLRDYADSLERIGDPSRALEVLEQAYELAPRDQFVGSKYAQVLENLGRNPEALSIMNGLLIAFPETAIYHHRASKINESLGNFEDAYKHAKKAVELDDGMYEAVMRLAALELRKGNINETKALLDEIPEEVHSKIKSIRDTIRAEMLLRDDKLSEARILLNGQKHGDSYCLDVLARIELKDAMNFVYSSTDRNYRLARDRIQSGISIVNAALKRYPNNFPLNRTLTQLMDLDEQIRIL